MSIAQVRPSKLKNITLYENNAYGDGMGTNIDGEFLFIYQGTGPGDFNNRTIASGISGITWWLKINSGRSISGYGSEDNELKKILINGGIKIE